MGLREPTCPICPIPRGTGSSSSDGQCVPGSSGDLPCPGSCSCDASPSPNGTGCTSGGSGAYSTSSWTVSYIANGYTENYYQTTGSPYLQHLTWTATGNDFPITSMIVTGYALSTGSIQIVFRTTQNPPPSTVNVQIYALAQTGGPSIGADCTAEDGLGDGQVYSGNVLSGTNTSSGTYSEVLSVEAISEGGYYGKASFTIYGIQALYLNSMSDAGQAEVKVVGSVFPSS